MNRSRSVQVTTRLHEQRMGPGFTAFGLRGLPGYALDPFLNLDDFRMSVPTFPPHPHAGFSAVTYMFQDSRGGFVNRDSLGDRSLIGPGALHWTQAARGMMHEEIPEVPGVECHGVQMFVNLRSDHKEAPPRAFHVAPADVPEITLGEGVRVRVLCGSLDEVRSPLTQLLTPILFLDVSLSPGSKASLPIAPDYPTSFAMAIAGAGTIGPDARPFAAHEAAGFAPDGDRIELGAGDRGLQVMVGAGRPIGEPVVFGGPFAMTSRHGIERAVERYERGEMGRLAPSF